MEALPAATLAGLTPKGVEVRFYDDRMEQVPFDESTDLGAISVETYTAKRAYQIASEYRKRHVPVVMGGFHATLCPDEVARHAEAVVCGEAELLWARVVDDARHLAACVYRALNGLLLGHLAVVMAVCNVGGSLAGTHLALKHGSGFVRQVFLVVVSLLILKFAWDTFS